MVVYNEWRLSLEHRPFTITEEAKYRYNCLVKYDKLRKKGLNEIEALEIIEVKRSTLFKWKKRYKENCGTIKMKTTGLENKSRRPHHLRKSKLISHKLISHILKIRQAEPMWGKEKIKRELDKEGVFVSVSTVGRVLKYLMDKGKIQNIKRLKSKNIGYRKEQR